MDDRRQVAELLGSPSTVGTFSAKTWYYMSKWTKTVSFLDPEILDQEVLQINFDNAGLVSDMRIYGLENARTITPDPNITPTSGKELDRTQQIMEDIGRFSSGASKGALKRKRPGDLAGAFFGFCSRRLSGRGSPAAGWPRC